MDQKLKNFIIATLRRASYRWSARTEAMRLARIERGLYKCAHCKGEFKRKQVHVDHINPVIDIKKGFTNWDDFINRLFCKVEQFQVLCEQCHSAKTSTERSLRTIYRKKRKLV